MVTFTPLKEQWIFHNAHHNVIILYCKCFYDSVLAAHDYDEDSEDFVDYEEAQPHTTNRHPHITTTMQQPTTTTTTNHPKVVTPGPVVEEVVQHDFNPSAIPSPGLKNEFILAAVGVVCGTAVLVAMIACVTSICRQPSKQKAMPGNYQSNHLFIHVNVISPFYVVVVLRLYVHSCKDVWQCMHCNFDRIILLTMFFSNFCIFR